MLYDVRFETGDVIHRVFKFIQLLLLGMAHHLSVLTKQPDSLPLQDVSTYITASRMTTVLKTPVTTPNERPASLPSAE